MCCAHMIMEVTKPLVVFGILSDLVWFLHFLPKFNLIAAISFDISYKDSAVF